MRGPAPVQQSEGKDIIEETITFFRANVMFKNFEMKGPADRVLCYLTLFVHQVKIVNIYIFLRPPKSPTLDLVVICCLLYSHSA